VFGGLSEGRENLIPRIEDLRVKISYKSEGIFLPWSFMYDHLALIC
jgi:hypothetical protein